MNEPPLTQILNQLAEVAVPDDLDLRAAIHHRLETSKKQRRTGVFLMKSIFAQPCRLAVPITIAFLILLATLMLTPQGLSWAQNVLQFFTYAESDNLPIETQVPGADTGWEFGLGAEEAQQRARFDVLMPTWLPDFLFFREVAVNSQRRMVVVSYDVVYPNDPSIGGNGIALSEQLIYNDSESCEICSLVGASAEIDEVQIGDIPGEYVVGVWQAIGDTGQWGWVSDPYLQRLRWHSDGMAFELLSFVNPDDLTKADLIAIAESLH